MIYQDIVFRYNNENCPMRTLHPLDTYRLQRFIKKIAGNHKNYWDIANNQYGNLILVIPRNAFKSRGRK